MLVVLTLVAPDLSSLETNLPHALEAVAGAGCTIEETDVLGDGVADLIVKHDAPAVIQQAAANALQYAPIDFCRGVYAVARAYTQGTQQPDLSKYRTEVAAGASATVLGHRDFQCPDTNTVTHFTHINANGSEGYVFEGLLGH